MSHSTRLARARRGFGLERQRAHREARMAPPLSPAEAEHIAIAEALSTWQHYQDSEAAGVAEGVREAASDGTVSPSSATPALPMDSDAQSSRGAPLGGRDPRLGNYFSSVALLSRAWKRLGLTKSDVYSIAGVPSDAHPDALLDFPDGGLPALYRACERKVKAA